jgi:recombination protein RecR
MYIPKAVEELSMYLNKLPGIGPKTAQRLAYYMLYMPQNELEGFGQSISTLKKKTALCSICHNVTESSPCRVCSDTTRDEKLILVVEQAIEIVPFEKSGTFKGRYHVLHGVINPLENIGPEEIFLEDLITRVSNLSGGSEVIVATNPTLEGEATAMYIAKRLKDDAPNAKVSRLGMGIPSGAHLEYADEITLGHALSGRRNL